MDANKVVELWDKYEMPDNIREHCLRVCALAIEISKHLITKKEKVNIDLVKYGALFHDIAKIYEIRGESHEHNILGRNILNKEGCSDFAKICEEHFLNYLDQHLLIESFVVNLADKLTNPDGYVTLKEKYESLYIKYPKYKHTFDKTFHIFEKEFKKIFRTEKKYLKLTQDLKKKLDFKNKKYIDIINEL